MGLPLRRLPVHVRRLRKWELPDLAEGDTSGCAEFVRTERLHAARASAAIQIVPAVGMDAHDTTSWLAITVILVLHWLGPVLNKIVDVWIAAKFGKPPDATK